MWAEMEKDLETWSLAIQLHSSSFELPAPQDKAYQAPPVEDRRVLDCSQGLETFHSRLG